MSLYPREYTSYPYHPVPLQYAIVSPLEVRGIPESERVKGTHTVFTVMMISSGFEVFCTQGRISPISTIG
jgi:hypothetical protein